MASKSSNAKLRVIQFRLHSERETLRLGPLEREPFSEIGAKVRAAKSKAVSIGADTAAGVAQLGNYFSFRRCLDSRYSMIIRLGSRPS
jgi:hypothetical protein